VPLDHPIIGRLGSLVPAVPSWYAGVEARRPAGVTARMDAAQARASAGQGLLLEYLAHEIREQAQPESRIPVMLNGTTVGRGVAGRECTSIDFSHAGDPLDVRHMRIAFSTYQGHRLRPDIFGWATSTEIPPMIALPRDDTSLLRMLARGRGLDAGLQAAAHPPGNLPDIREGLSAVIDRYETSALAAFHRDFEAACLARERPGRALDLAGLPACFVVPWLRPNDLLLKPTVLQHLVRGLMARGWDPVDIARLIQAHYEGDHGWGARWSRMDPRTRAEFDVRVFAGLALAGSDRLVDFNCVSAQEKDLCPRTPCQHDLRRDRARLGARRSA
jgi:hypothetical protein